MITTMSGCVAHNDLWPWPISSRSFGLDLENRVRFVASTVLDGFFLPLSPPGWRGIVVTVRAGGWAGGCQTCGTHISVTFWRIFSIRSSVELSRPLVVHCHGHLPHMGLPMGQKLVKFGTNWVQTLRNAYLWNSWMDLPHLNFHGLV